MLARRSLSLALLLLAPLAAGCGDETVAPAFVGQVAGTDAVVGAVSEADQIAFYVCGGPSSYAHLTRWFTGDVAADGSIDLQNAGWTLTGDLVGGSGTLAGPVGETHPWTARPVSGEVDGLYSYMVGSCRTGAVVGDLDGTGALRLQGTWCDGYGEFAQVTPILPMSDVTAGVALSGIPVAVEVKGASEQLIMERVRHP
jgi:hypothetical protein